MTLGYWQVWQGWRRDFSESVLVPREVHGGLIVKSHDWGDVLPEADGVIAESGDGWVGVDTADCLPLVLVTNTSALVLHVSRKTLVHGLLDTVPTMFSVADISSVWIGPHICPEHFTFEWLGNDVTMFQQRWPTAVVSDTVGFLHLSLNDVVQQYLTEWEVSSEQVHRDDRCTYESSDVPSYRRALGRKEKVKEQWLTAVRRVGNGSEENKTGHS